MNSLLADAATAQAIGYDRLSAAGREVVDETSFGRWFQPGDHIQDLLSVATGVGNCEYLGYRPRVADADGDFIVEQHAYCTLAKAGRIGWIRMLCSGYRPDPDIDAAQHDMDAGAHAIRPRGRQLAIDIGAGSVLPVPGSRAE